MDNLGFQNTIEDWSFLGFWLFSPKSKKELGEKVFDSRDYNLYRVSNNSRYTKDCTPRFQDKVKRVNGQVGSYYFGTKYSETVLPITIAYDNLSKEKLDEMVDIFSSLLEQNGVFELVMYEEPWKKWLVQFNKEPILTCIPFDDNNGNEVFKGEGTIDFICLEPFSRSTYKTLDDFKDENNSFNLAFSDQDIKNWAVTFPKRGGGIRKTGKGYIQYFTLGGTGYYRPIAYKLDENKNEFSSLLVKIPYEYFCETNGDLLKKNYYVRYYIMYFDGKYENYRYSSFINLPYLENQEEYYILDFKTGTAFQMNKEGLVNSFPFDPVNVSPNEIQNYIETGLIFQLAGDSRTPDKRDDYLEFYYDYIYD